MDLRANELWVVVPTDTFLARLPNLSPKVQEGVPIVLWRGLVRAQTAEPPQHTACCAHGTRTVHAWCTRGARIGQATHDGWHVRYGGGELSTEWVTSGQAALLWHALTPTMHSTTLQRSRVTVLGLAAARGRPALRMPTLLLRATLWAQTPLRRLPTPLRFAFGRARPEEEVGTHAAATLQRYYAFCAAAESTPGLVVG